jgi:hypothetical protein
MTNVYDMKGEPVTDNKPDDFAHWCILINSHLAKADEIFRIIYRIEIKLDERLKKLEQRKWWQFWHNI